MHTQHIYAELAKTAKVIAMPFYWLDLNQVIQGANKLVAASIGVSSTTEVIGKTPYDLYPHEFAQAIESHHQAVISSGETLVVEEAIRNRTTNVVQYYTATIWPLRDDEGEIIGTVGTSTDITVKKIADERLRHEKVLAHLAMAAEIFPVPVYWLDMNQKFIGVNNLVLLKMGAKFSKQELVGKTPLDIYPEIMAHNIMHHHKEVIHTGQLFSGEETIEDFTTGRVKYFNTIIAPLRDDEGNIIGTIGTSLDITQQKEAEYLKQENEAQKTSAQEQEKIRIQTLEKIIELLPIPVYWINECCVMLSTNIAFKKTIGVELSVDLVGKTAEDIYPGEIAQKLIHDNKIAMQNNKVVMQEEQIINFDTNERKYLISMKAPLHDLQGKVIGLMGTSLDITAQKEAEYLKQENEAQKASAQEQEKFRKLADQVAHDIRSPLSSLLMIVKACQAIPEKERVALREAATTINDIANNLLSNYRKKEVDHGQALTIGKRESVLVFPLLSQIFTDKKYEYGNLSIKFNDNFSQAGNFAWIKIETTAFKRMLSNVINNAVDALNQKEGKITLHLDADEKQVHITVEDNGKGMNPELVRKIMNNVAVTEGKEDGNGIGLTQVRETLQNNQGQWVIDSQVDQGTQFKLTFPRVKPLNWIAEAIKLFEDDTVVVLDDDSSIRMAWNMRFDKIVQEFPQLIVKHFEQGREAIAFINGFTPDEKQKVFLLADYELLKQDVTGLDVIRETNTKRSILVTSHYANKEVQQLAAKTNTKILPKQLASDIGINIRPALENEIAPVPDSELKEVDVIFVDDDQQLLDSFTFFAFNKKVNTYQDPQVFLDNIHQYPKHTKIMLDQNFDNFDQKGIQIAEHLHALGFTRLYLLSGGSFSEFEIPEYLTLIKKTDLDTVEAILNEQFQPVGC